jgi:hypothetical protein
MNTPCKGLRTHRDPCFENHCSVTITPRIYESHLFISVKQKLGAIAQAYNLTYLGGRDYVDRCSRTAQNEKVLETPISTSNWA